MNDGGMQHLPDLSFFTTLARHPSLASAGAELGLSPPAVSRRLAALEHRLAVRLLNRTTRRMSLTPEGERYLADGERILRDIERLERSLQASRDEPQGLLRLNATFGFGRRHLAPAISAFAQRHPKVQVMLELTDKPLDLTAHAMDLGIRFGPPPDARVLARRIVANRRLLCASPAFLSLHGIPLDPMELSRLPCIVIRENNRAWNHWTLSRGQESRLVKVQGALSTNHGEVAVDWALDGHGLLLRSEWDVQGLLQDGRLVQVLPEWSDTAADIHAVYPQRHHLAATVRSFIEFLVSWFDPTTPSPNGSTAARLSPGPSCSSPSA
jgi:LysR family transcriptional regulator, transcriptional activator for dmlA